MIICGFPGVGKSEFAKLSQWVELESSLFKNHWMIYASVAKKLSNDGYVVLVSTHEELLASLEMLEARYVVVVPSRSDKEVYLQRYMENMKPSDSIFLIKDNWDKWLSNIADNPTYLKTVVTLPINGTLKDFADTFYVR